VIGSSRVTVFADSCPFVEVLDVVEKIACHNTFKRFSAMPHPELPVVFANNTRELKRTRWANADR
jgi:hypothetical protein